MLLRNSFLALVIVIAAAGPARADLAKNARCTLNEPVVLEEGAGTLEAGTDVVVTKPGKWFTNLTWGKKKGLAPTPQLAAACAPMRRSCALLVATTLAPDPAAKKKAKPVALAAGESVVLLGRAPGGTRVESAAGTGIAKATPTELCGEAAPPPPPAPVVAAPPPPPERPEGGMVAILPFAIGDGVADEVAIAFEGAALESLAALRGDVFAVKPQGSRVAAWKAHLATSTARATALGVPYFITGRAAETDGGWELLLGLVSTRDGKMMKGVRARPTSPTDRGWAPAAIRPLHELLPAGAPPAAKVVAAPEAAPVSDATPAAEEGAPLVDAPVDAGKPWFVNGLAYTAVGAGAVVAASGVVFGGLAALDRAAYDSATPASTTRPGLRGGTVAKALVADGLYAGALVMGGVAAIIFATGVDYDTFLGSDEKAPPAAGATPAAPTPAPATDVPATDAPPAAEGASAPAPATAGP